MSFLRLVHSRREEAPSVTPEEHDRQRALVDMSTRLSARRQERRDEAAAMARLYARPRTRVENVSYLRPRDPEPPRTAA